ncbi:MAG: hypothetical protein PF440_11475 [Thiomicrorhabdus sp.]|jgi:hypothetical protein|nr:hypothetical protein [Thiomicrorhabdus sp.]
MRAVKAKKLRAIARKLTIGEPNVKYIEGRDVQHVPIMGDMGKVARHHTIPGIPTVMVEGCTREVCKQLKRIK